jgi:hypothetical protein
VLGSVVQSLRLGLICHNTRCLPPPYLRMETDAVSKMLHSSEHQMIEKVKNPVTPRDSGVICVLKCYTIRICIITKS